MRVLLSGLAAALLLAASPAAACIVPDEVAAWLTRAPVTAEPGDCKFAIPTRDAWLRHLQDELGPQVGYKAGLTTKAAQDRFGTEAPVLGLLFQRMILDDGAEVDARFGARGMWEADFLLVVGDEAINEAADREQALASLRGYRPFIELPDLIYGPDVRVFGHMLAVINVGARLGVAGRERPLPAKALTALADMRVRAFDGSGALLAEGQGSDALGHPLDVVLWVRDQVKAEGGRLKPGDVISVGAFTPLTPPAPGQTVRVRYEGLPGDPEVSVRFR